MYRLGTRILNMKLMGTKEERATIATAAEALKTNAMGIRYALKEQRLDIELLQAGYRDYCDWAMKALRVKPGTIASTQAQHSVACRVLSVLRGL